QWRTIGERRVHVEHRGQLFIFDSNRLERLVSAALVLRNDCRNRLSQEPDLSDRQQGLVFGGVPVIWVNSVQVTSGQNGDYTRLAQDFTGIDRENARMSDRASQQLRIGHAVQPDVARKDGPARDLGHAVFARNRMIDDAELPVLHANLSLVWIWKLR